MSSLICAVGDTHGHLQLALCTIAHWQREQGIAFEAVFLCGDVATFTSEEQLDKATQRHGKTNLCELEFLYQWSVEPFPAWLRMIFQSEDHSGLGLTCPVVMVHGNHEGFSHLQTFVSTIPMGEVVEIDVSTPACPSLALCRAFHPISRLCSTFSASTCPARDRAVPFVGKEMR